MIAPTEDDIGAAVVYTGNRYPGGKPEDGIITSFNTQCVFVRYRGDQNSKATSRADLEWSAVYGETMMGSAEYWQYVSREADEQIRELQAHNAKLVAALKKIANGEGYYGAQAREYKEIARGALAQQSTEKP